MGTLIQDSVHGMIELPEWAERIIDTPQLQRLRRIKQLGFANLVYPGANHSRFEHSLGVFYITKKLTEKLEISKDSEMEILISAIIHDSAHAPFSHSSERIIKRYLGKTHERIDFYLKSTELEDVIKELGFSLRDVARHLSEESYGIVSGEIDADRMDYLVRDSHYTGVAYGVFDITRLINTTKFVNDRLVIDKKGLKSAESLLISRFMMYPTVYHHHVCRIARKMYEKALERCIELGELEARDLVRMDDYDMVSFLRSSNSFSKEIIDRIDRRDLFKRAIYVGRDRVGDVKISERRAELEIAEIADVDVDDVIVDIPPETDVREVSALVHMDDGLKKLEDCSPLVKTLRDAERDIWMLGVYTTKENIRAVAKASVKLFNIERIPKQRRLDEVINF
ncbi:HD superfamily phosphohydrolase [Archaeoglobus sulfaticallidus PM70-1]|uniref:HD superfamily phosphohydrolase n=1 Tax=Archaeoglobus sulfaticallidus PM70-1 TaxID=387631 RepID=N0B998_9EURY|nr:HD domain-containing protein [Archaeoglobus sulfaticallidus]AGK60189.1 HD superfamily phosphohydrolase [Archaeoglobus sulfaticallidus PM70-1]